MPFQPFVVAPVVLGVVLVVAGTAKLRDRRATLSAAVALRLPPALRARWVGIGLPVAELGVACGVCAPWLPVVRGTAVAALGLLVGYTVIVGRALGFDPRPACPCFGRLGEDLVSVRTFVRNIVLVALAVVLLLWSFAGHTVPDALAAFSRGDVLWAIGVLLAVAVAVLVAGGSPRPHDPSPAASRPAPARAPADADAARSPDESPAPGADDGADLDYIRGPIPEALLIDPAGAPVTLRELARERAQLLVLGNCVCGPTVAAFLRVPEWAETLPAIDVRYVFSGIAPRDEHNARTTGWLDHAGLAWRALGLESSPAAVLLGADGLLAGGPVNGFDALVAFVDEIGAALAEPAPATLRTTASR